MEVDLAFVLDCTGSMGGWITKTQEDIKSIVTTIEKSYPHVRMRLACVGYRDYGDSPNIETLDFSTDVESFKRWVSALKATGGADQCEDVLGGLNACGHLNWKSPCKVLFHICDAPPHNKKFHDGCGDSYPDDTKYDHRVVLSKLAAKGNMRYCISKLNNTLKKMITVFTQTGNDINLLVEEKEMTTVTELMTSVVKSVTEAIKSIKISKKPRTFTGEKKTGRLLKREKAHKFKVIVGIDFGTDGSGYAWTLTDGEGKVHAEQRWPGSHLADVKTKTNILLDERGRTLAFGHEATEKYAQSTNKEHEFYERFKMALYDKKLVERKEEKKSEDKKSTPKTVELESYLTAANGRTRNSVEVLQAALKYMKTHIMNILKEGAGITDVNDVQWILTVPAIWSNSAKTVMRDAASKAKMIDLAIEDHLKIAYEPECGSVVARQYIDLKAGDTYILLDLGGGTADFACHQVIDGIHATQVYQPTGGPWGSTYIDEAFLEMLDAIFGKSNIKDFKKESPNNYIQLKENFRKAKQLYDAKEEEPPTIVIDGLVEFLNEKGIEMEELVNNVRDYKLEGKSNIIDLDESSALLTLGHKGWQYLFDKVVIPTLNHTEWLLRQKELRTCEIMLCVGGLAQSAYVIESLKKKFNRRIAKFAVPKKPILSVVEGAARFGLSPSMIKEYKCPRTYGLKYARPWKEGDGEENKLYDAAESAYFFENGFYAFVKKGQMLNVDDPPIIEYFTPLNDTDKEIEIEIYATDETEPRCVSDSDWCGRATFTLPSTWASSKDKDIPVAFFFNHTEIRIKVELENYPEEERYVRVAWAED